MIFETTISVNFDEADPGKILFFARHLTWAHRVVERFCQQTDIGWKNWFQSDQWAVPLRQIEADYQKPLWPGESYLARLQVTHVGETSVQFEIQFFTADEEKLCTTIKTTHVFVDLLKIKKRSIPDGIRKVLKSYLRQ